MFRITHAQVRPEPRSHHFVSIIGNVGAGKSTLTRALSDLLGMEASFERVDGNPYLGDFYANPNAWGFHLQIYFLIQRSRDLAAIRCGGRDTIQDRSIYEDVEIFARGLYESGRMAEREYRTYQDLYDSLADQLIRPDLAIYLNGSLETILHRIAIRGRESERNVPVSYWAGLHGRYERFMATYDSSPVLWVDIDRFDLYKHPEHLSMLAGEVRRFLSHAHSRAVG